MHAKQEDLPPFEALGDLEAELHQRGLITFDRIFKEATGFYLIKCFLMADYSADKAMFVSDVEVFKNMRDEMGRIRVQTSGGPPHTARSGFNVPAFNALPHYTRVLSGVRAAERSYRSPVKYLIVIWLPK